MDAASIKKDLKPEDVEAILESLGCENIKHRSGYITATRPGGDNKNGVVVYTDDYRCIMPTTPSFEKYPVKDILSVVQYMRRCSFPEAIKYVCAKIGIDYYAEVRTNKLSSWLDMVEAKTTQQGKEQHILDARILDNYIHYIIAEWKNQGADDKADKFKIRYDLDNDCVIIPIINSIGDLVGIKCRANSEDATSKFWYARKCEKSKVVYGLYQNYGAIVNSGTVIVYEAEKSVIKSCNFGVENCVAIGGKALSSDQAEEIMRLGCDVVIALDMDVSDEDIYNFAKALCLPIAFNNIFILRDSDGILLGEKDSPADCKEFIENWQEQSVLYVKKGDTLL